MSMRTRSLRLVLIAGAAFGLIAREVGADDGLAGRDKAGRYAGDWVLHAIERHGERTEGGFVGTAKIEGRRFEASTAFIHVGGSETGTFSVVEDGEGCLLVDVKARYEGAGTMTTRVPAKEPEEVVTKELWRLVGDDTFERCLTIPEPGQKGGYRPTGFATKAGDGRMVFIYKRVKP